MYHYLQAYKIVHMSILEKHIGKNVVPVVLQLKELGERTAYLHSETDDDGNRKVCGIIELTDKRYECILDQAPCDALRIMPVDDGSYNNMNRSRADHFLVRAAIDQEA